MSIDVEKEGEEIETSGVDRVDDPPWIWDKKERRRKEMYVSVVLFSFWFGSFLRIAGVCK